MLFPEITLEALVAIPSSLRTHKLLGREATSPQFPMPESGGTRHLDGAMGVQPENARLPSVGILDLVGWRFQALVLEAEPQPKPHP